MQMENWEKNGTSGQFSKSLDLVNFINEFSADKFWVVQLQNPVFWDWDYTCTNRPSVMLIRVGTLKIACLCAQISTDQTTKRKPSDQTKLQMIHQVYLSV